MANEQLQELLGKFLGEQMNPEEIGRLQTLIRDEANTAALDELLQRAYADPSLVVHNDYDATDVFAVLQEKIRKRSPAQIVPIPPRKPWPRIAVAAAILLLLATGAYFLFNTHQHPPAPVIATNTPHDVIAPASTRASITLHNGEQVYLDSVAAGQLALQGNVKLIKKVAGGIAYQPASGNATGAPMYNMINNPRGSQVIDITLSDGTRVWLNAASSLKYPTAFTGHERIVEISGEAYFEVAQNPGRPFTVKKGTTTVAVLGTHFNVNAYDDEMTIKISLLEGMVKVNTSKASSLLRPGEQVVIRNATEGLSKTTHVDLDAVMAWKNGLFAFTGADLPMVMRELSRWYNVEVDYDGKIPKRAFNGKIGKTLTLDQVLRLLTKTRVHYSINGHKLTIRP